MNQTFELRTDGKLADYNEATDILYGLNSQSDSESCFVKAESIKKSSFRLRKNAGNVKIFQLDDSDY